MTSAGEGRTYKGLAEIGTVARLSVPAYEFTAEARHEDFTDLDRHMEELARNATATASSTALVVDSSVGSVVELSLILSDDGEDLLDDARSNIKEGNDAEGKAAYEAYEVALGLLTEYLEMFPEHPEARYLRAYCLYRQGGEGQMEALRILRPLRDEPVQDELRSRVAELRADLRRQLTPGAIAAFTSAIRASRSRALARLAEYMELAPEEGTPAYLVAGTQARSGDLEAAYRTAKAGAKAAENERERVAALARRLELTLVTPLAEPAVAAFKDGDYRLAQHELLDIGSQWRDATVVRDFYSYLGTLSGLAPGAALPPPHRSRDRADAVYSLIAETDAQRTAALINAGRLRLAELTAAEALRHAPLFPWLNFLYAVSLYIQGTDPDRAFKAARIAERDPSITQARDLLTAIEVQRDSLDLDPVVDEFTATMDTVRGGAGAREIEALQARLTRLRSRLSPLLTAMRTEAGARAVRDLGDVIDRLLAETSAVIGVARLYDKYDQIMSSVQGGLREPQQADRLGAALSGLAAEISKTRTRRPRDESQLTELASLVAERTRELEAARTSLAIGALVERFNAVANLGPAGTGWALSELIAIRAEARRLQPSATRPRDQELLRQLIRALAQLP